MESTAADKCDREERLSIRRNRISGKSELDSSKGEASSAKEGVDKLSEEQILASFKRLDDTQAKSTVSVTEVRVKADQREVQRRDAEEEDNRKRDELLKQAYFDSQDDDCITSGWKRCSSANNAQDLCVLLDEQKSRCDSAMFKLENLSNVLGTHLRQKDLEYVTALKRNREEIELLQNCITQEHRVLKEAFETELKQIEKSFETNKHQITNTKKKALDVLISERNHIETQCLERQHLIIEEQRNEIKESESKGERDSRALKEKMESELRRLEIELEGTRTRHQFDADKLEYDVRVLTELSENEAAVKKQKKRIMKGKEELNREVEINQRENAREWRRNEILEDDCERIERQSSGLREKFERFKVSDDEKYRAILALHRDDLRKLHSELKDSEEFIFEGAIGCSGSGTLHEATDASCVSDVTFPDDSISQRLSIGDKGLDDCGHPNAANRLEEEICDRSDEWHQAETLMANYRNILEKREGLNAEVKSVESQNEKLEEELKSKLKDKINEELAFPPSMTSVGDTQI